MIYVIVDNTIHAVKNNITGMPLSRSFLSLWAKHEWRNFQQGFDNLYLAVYSYSSNYQQTNTEDCNGVY